MFNHMFLNHSGFRSVAGQILGNLSPSLRRLGQHKPGTAATDQYTIYAYARQEDGRWLHDQSLVYVGESCVVIGFAQLYNTSEICRNLHITDSPAIHTGIDLQQFILDLAYKKWGTALIDQLEGEFSFVVVDRSNGSLHCFRDFFGFRQLYYCVKGTSLVYSDSLAGIRAITAETIDYNERFLSDYLSLQIPDSSATVFSSCQSLPPGHVLTFQNNQVTITGNSISEKKFTIQINSDPVEQLRELLRDAVQKRISEQSKIIMQVSGGLDSSAVLAYLAQHFKRNGLPSEKLVAVTRTFAVNYRDKFRDELSYAEDICNLYRITLHQTEEEIVNPLSHIEDYYSRLGNFPINPFFAIGLPVYQLMARLKAGTIFTGFGGDEMVSLPGDTILPWLFVHGKFKTLLKLLPRYRRVYHKSSWQVWRSQIFRSLLSEKAAQYWQRFRYPQSIEENRLTFLSLSRFETACSNEYQHEKIKQHQVVSVAEEICRGIDNSIFSQIMEVFSYIREKENVIFIHPLLDKNLLKFMLSVAPEQLLLDGWQRSIFRRAIQKDVPESICKRKNKSPFSLPYTQYIQADANLIRDICATSNSIAWDYLDRKEIADWTERICRQEKMHAADFVALKIGMAINIALFLEYQHRNKPSLSQLV